MANLLDSLAPSGYTSNMKPLRVFVLITAAVATASAAWAANESDYILRMPLNSDAALSGDMFTNNTEILTPQGIIDDPSTPTGFDQEPAAGPSEADEEQLPDETAAMPYISPPTGNSTMLSPTTISPSTVSVTQPAG